jgi:hypothetical protein
MPYVNFWIGEKITGVNWTQTSNLQHGHVNVLFHWHWAKSPSLCHYVCYSWNSNQLTGKEARGLVSTSLKHPFFQTRVEQIWNLFSLNRSAGNPVLKIQLTGTAFLCILKWNLENETEFVLRNKQARGPPLRWQAGTSNTTQLLGNHLVVEANWNTLG